MLQEIRDVLIVRPMTLADIESVYELEAVSFKTPWPKSAFVDELANKLAHYLVGEIDGKIVGYVGSWVLMGECHINNVATAPEYRGKGIAKQIMLELMKVAYNNGATRMTLEVREHNQSAKQLYERLNFKYAGRRRRYYADTGEDAFIMWNDDILATIVLNGGGCK